MPSLFISSLLLFVSSFVAPMPAQAWTEKALLEADPFSFTPNDVSLASFKLDGPVLWEWVEGSLEWVRVDRRFQIPRAKVILTVPATAKVTYDNQIFLPSLAGKVEVPVVLTQERTENKRNEIVIEDPVTKLMSRALIVFQSRNITQPVTLDSSCSPVRLKVTSAKVPRSWIYLTCKVIHPATGSGYSNKVDLDVYWEMENGPDSLQVNGRRMNIEDGLTTSIALDSNTQTYKIRRGSGDQVDEIEFEVKVAQRFHPLGVSVGLGPYSHQDVVRAFTTIYASYFFNEQLKLAGFGAFPIRQSPELDLGLYLVAEQFRGVDERISVNLLLGFHTLSFVPAGQRIFSFSAPQGIEVIFRDLIWKRQNLMVGGFFYPDINSRSYVNSWIRYGGSTFVELNYIRWQEPLAAGGSYGAKSFGLSIGFPLFRAL